MLKKARKEKGLTQAQLGKMAKLSQSYISDLEKNYFIYSPTVRQILALSHALCISKVKLFLYFAKKELEFNANR